MVMGKLLADADRAAVDAALAGIAALDPPGLIAMTLGPDVGLREGGWSFAIVNDWDEPASYQAYDVEPEHNRHRAVLREHCEQIARVQFEL